MFKTGEKVRIKKDIDFTTHPLDIGTEYRWKSEIEKIAGSLRKIQSTYDDYPYIDANGNSAVTQRVYFRGYSWLPAEWVERDIKKFKTIKLDNVTANTVLGQDKIKKQLTLSANQDIPALLIGETGTGKTTIVKDIAEKLGKKWIRFNLTGETTVDEFVGKYVLENGKTVWQDGVLLYAMKNGLWLIVDEINVALPEILFVLHSLLDDDKSVMVAQHEGEVVKPHKNFRFFATMNPIEEYAGTKELNKAFMSRFGVIVQIHYPRPEYEKAVLIHKAGADEELANKAIDIAITLRRAKKDGDIYYTCSTRDLIQFCRLAKLMPINDAIQLTIINKANGDGDKIKELAKNIVGGYDEVVKEYGTLNLNDIKQKIAETAKELQDKEYEISQAESELREKIELLAEKEKELENKIPSMKKAIRRELILELGRA